MAKKDSDFLLNKSPQPITRGEINKVLQEFKEQLGIAVATGGISANVISELLAGSGVTADGVLLKDGALTLSSGALTLADGGVVVSPNVIEYTKEIAITGANIIAIFGTPVQIVAGISGRSLEFRSAVLVYDYETAAYTGGGDVTLEYGSGGSTLSTTIISTNSFAASGDKVYTLVRLNAAGGLSLAVNTGIYITNASGAFVDPGTAAGVGRIHITYRVHNPQL